MEFSRIKPAEAALTNAGNRYDVLGGGVLYAGTQLEAAYGETLGRFRPSPQIIAKMGGRHEDGYMNVGTIAADWRLRRIKMQVTCPGSLPFLDVEDARTVAQLNIELADDLAALGETNPLDVSDVRGRNRIVTRHIAGWAYAQQDNDGNFVFGGIRYKSKLGDWECWAIFDGTPVESSTPAALSLSDPGFIAIAQIFGLTIC